MHLTRSIAFVVIFLAVVQCSLAQNNVYLAIDGDIVFRSDAPQELIKAKSNELKGALETAGKSFSFKVRMSSFEGFNSALQQTHFNENYIESTRYPEAVFKGKIIEDIDWNKTGTYSVRAKGIMQLHGVEQERIIKGVLTILPDKTVRVESNFSMLLSDYNIPIPRIVKEKLADEIKVAIKVDLQSKN